MPKKEEAEDKLSRYKALDERFKAIGLRKNNYFPLTEDVKLKVEFQRTGLASFDMLLGGGIPLGYLITFEGQPGAGKTTLAEYCAGVFQRERGPVLWIDVEHRFYPDWAEKNGMSMAAGSLALIQPENAQQALEALKIGVSEKDGFSLVVFDSIGSLIPKEMYEGDVGSGQMAARARLLSSTLPQIASLARASNVGVIILNQLRNRMTSYGNPEGPMGGAAAQYFPSIRLEFRRKEIVEQDKEPSGIRTQIKSVKNSIAAPFGATDIIINFGSGVDRVSNIVEAALQLNIIQRPNKMSYTLDEQKYVGIGALYSALAEDSTIVDMLYERITHASS